MPDISSFIKKQSMTQKSVNLKRNLLIIIMAYILLLQSNTLAADVFNARSAQANLIDKTTSYQVLTEKLSQINQNTYLLKMKLINKKNFLWTTF